MSTLYRPVLITSAEQAEALPIGTVAVNGGLAACKSERYAWDCNGGYEETPNEWMVGWTALVPVEAEEERVQRVEHSPSGYETAVYSESRYVTPWEES